MESSKNPLVCFFDSGIGGLGLLYECVHSLPRVDFIYFADNFRVPYGNLSKAEILKYTVEIFDEINKLNPAAAVVACNTVTAHCIEYLRKKYPFKIIGVQPAVKPAAACGKCIVLATEATAKSDSLNSLVKDYGKGVTEVFACRGLADYIEQNIFSLSESEIIKFLPDANTQGVVLGCTHYAFAGEVIGKYYNCPIFDGIKGTADNLTAKLGISDHCTARAHKIMFRGGDSAKNKAVFNMLLKKRGIYSQNSGN